MLILEFSGICDHMSALVTPSWQTCRFGAFGPLAFFLESPSCCGDLEEVIHVVCRCLLLPLENMHSKKGTLSSPFVIVDIDLCNGVNQQTVIHYLCRP